MSRSGSFGLNPKKTYGTAPSINEAVLGDLGSNPEGEWVFVQAASAVAQYDAVAISRTYTVASLTTTTAGSNTQQIGVSQAALASGEYGWVWIGGAMGGGTGKGVKVNVSAAVSAGANLYTTATAGSVSSTSTTLIKNLAAAGTTSGSGVVEVLSTGYLTVN